MVGALVETGRVEAAMKVRLWMTEWFLYRALQMVPKGSEEEAWLAAAINDYANKVIVKMRSDPAYAKAIKKIDGMQR
jgi:hypothetical protein